MEELIKRICASVGIDEDTAKISIGHVLGFLQKEFPEGPVAELLGKIPGGQDAIAAAAAAPGSGGTRFAAWRPGRSCGWREGRYHGARRQIDGSWPRHGPDSETWHGNLRSCRPVDRQGKRRQDRRPDPGIGAVSLKGFARARVKRARRQSASWRPALKCILAKRRRFCYFHPATATAIQRA